MATANTKRVYLSSRLQISPALFIPGAQGLALVPPVVGMVSPLRNAFRERRVGRR